MTEKAFFYLKVCHPYVAGCFVFFCKKRCGRYNYVPAERIDGKPANNLSMKTMNGLVIVRTMFFRRRFDKEE